MTITTRAGKGSPLTNAELDANWADIIAARSAHLADTANPHSTTKAQVGLGNVDNTSDINKPVSTATTTQLNLKVNTSAIVNDLITGGTTVPLSAQQGVVLKGLTDTNTTNIALKVNTSAIVNDLITGGTTVPLSAQQGVVLKGLADTNATNIALKANASSPVFSGLVTSPGATVTTANAMGALSIDVTKGLNTKTIAIDSTLTFSATPAADTWFALHLTNSDTVSHIITIPSSFSTAQQISITSLTIPASGQLLLQWRYTGSVYILLGDTVSGDSAEITVASATTTPIFAAPSNNVAISGVTTITAFDTANAGIVRIVRATGAFLLTHNATTLILPGGTNITTVSGDIFAVRSEGSGNSRILWYIPTTVTGSGAAVRATAPTFTNPVVGTQSPNDNSTKAASTAYVDNAISGVSAGTAPNFAETGTFRMAPAAHGSGTTFNFIGTGTSIGAQGTATSRGANFFNASFPKVDRLGLVGTLGSNALAGLNATATMGTVPGNAGDVLRMRFSFGISDSITSGARMIVAVGQGSNGSGLPTTGEYPASVLNYVGITLRSNETQFRFSSRGASGTAYESALLGADFSPYGGTGTNGQGTTWYELDIKFTPGQGDGRNVVMTLRNKVTGTSVNSGTLTATSTGSQLPTAGQHNFPCCMRNSGSTDTNVTGGTIGAQIEIGDVCGGGFSGV